MTFKEKEEVLQEDHFLDTEDDMLEYLEAVTEKAVNEAVEIKNINKEKADKVLNYLLLGIGSSALLLINGFDKINSVFTLTLLFLIVGWFISAGILIFKTRLSIARPSAYNSPENLYCGGFKSEKDKNKLGILRRYELYNSNAVLKEFDKLNLRYCKYTDMAILIAISVPVITVMMIFMIA